MKRITIFLLLFIMTGTIAYSQIPQNFEAEIPAGWTTYNNAFGSFQWTTINAVTTPPVVCEGSISAYVNGRENIGAGNTSEKWLVSSLVTVPVNGQLLFSTHSTINGFDNTTYQVRVSTVSQNTGFQIVAQWTEEELTQVFNICEEKTVDLSVAGYEGQDVYIAFVMLVTQPTATPTGDRWIVDKVRLVESCLNPENIQVTGIGHDSATISWDNPSGANLFEVEIVEFPNTPTGVGVQLGPGTSYLPTLNPSTQYEVYVRALCAEINSQWVGPTNFLTTSSGGTGNGVNIYTSNGSLPENRQVELGGFNLNFVKGGRVGVGTNNLFSKFTIGDDTDELFTEIEPAITDVKALFEIKSNEKRGKYYKFNISQYKDFTWMQSSLNNRDASTLSINPLKGNVGIGVLDATAQLHTINSVRFEDLPFVSKKPIAVLGTDIDGNVFNYDPNLFGGVGTTQDAWLLNGNALTNPGTGVGQNFIGTTDAKDLVFGVANDEKMRITQSGRLNFYNHNGSQTYARNLYIGGGNDTAVVPTTSNFANVAVGMASLSSNTTGSSNSAVGNNSLRLNTKGNSNSSFGADSSQFNSEGNSNSSFGYKSLEFNNKGSANTAIGSLSLQNVKGSSNTAVGFRAGFSLTNSNPALYNSNNSNNVFIGCEAGYYLNTGINNILIGYRTTSSFSNGAVNLTSGNNNIFIGNQLQPTQSGVSNELNIGNWIFGKNGQIAIGSFTSLTSLTQAFITNNDFQLIVKKGIRTEKVRVDIASVKNWADHVFTKDYSLLPLSELEKYISANGHLPNIPKAEEVVKEGIDLGEMNAKLLEKVEELTLHSIELNKKNESQQKLIDDLIERLEKLEKNTKQ
jgi:hypothetical protein